MTAHLFEITNSADETQWVDGVAFALRHFLSAGVADEAVQEDLMTGNAGSVYNVRVRREQPAPLPTGVTCLQKDQL